MSAAITPAKWPRTIQQGADNDWPLRRVDALGAPIIPTFARAQVRKSVGGELWLDLRSDVATGARITIDPADGWIHVLIPHAATEGIDWNARKRGIWDIEVTSPLGVHHWARGPVIVEPDVTREVASA